MINSYLLFKNSTLKSSNFKKLRFAYYLLFSILYFIFMAKNSYLGVDWIDYHKEWVLNATNNIINGFEGLKYGLTSRDNIKLVGDLKSKKVYVVQAYQYFHLTLFSMLSNGKLTIFLGQLVDKIIICLTAILTGEITIILFVPVNLSNRVFNWESALPNWSKYLPPFEKQIAAFFTKW